MTWVTVTVANAPVVKGTPARICVRASASGSGRPNGRVDLAVSKMHGSVVFAGSKQYEGRRRCFTTQKLNRTGKYLVRATFQQMSPSPSGEFDNTTVLRVVRSQ